MPCLTSGANSGTWDSGIVEKKETSSRQICSSKSVRSGAQIFVSMQHGLAREREEACDVVCTQYEGGWIVA